LSSFLAAFANFLGLTSSDSKPFDSKNFFAALISAFATFFIFHQTKAKLGIMAKMLESIL